MVYQLFWILIPPTSLTSVVTSPESNKWSSLAQAGKFQELSPIPNLGSADRHSLASWKVNKWYLCFDLPCGLQDGTVHWVISTWAMPFSQALFILQNSRQTHPLQRRLTKLPSPCTALPSYWIINVWIGGVTGLAIFPWFSLLCFPQYWLS